jgi:hypothetical protein
MRKAFDRKRSRISTIVRSGSRTPELHSISQNGLSIVVDDVHAVFSMGKQPEFEAVLFSPFIAKILVNGALPLLNWLVHGVLLRT